MAVRNVIFDAGGVLIDWNPPAFVAKLYPDPGVQARIRQQIFDHADWHEFDRGTLTEDAAARHFATLAGIAPEEVRALIRTARESLSPIPGTIQLLEELAAAGINLYLLSNMPVSTYEYLVGRDRWLAHFKHMVISGAILMLKPEPAIYKHLVDTTGIVPSESVFIDDLLRNVIAARECGLHAIQFRGADDCRNELRRYLPHLDL
jgi:HAD superfamily hydrolase (TIGR01509 family)